jgi:chromosome segregation ATPase
MISFNYKNIVSKDDTNFFNVYDLSFIDNNYVNIINRLINVINFINNIKNNQLGGERKHNYSDEENEEIRKLKKKIDQLTNRIKMMQQQQMFLNNNSQMSLHKAEMYQNALIQHNANLTQCKADNQIMTHKIETQQNELNQCKADREILTNDNSNLKEKILFFDKSLEILSKEIDKNVSNGMIHLKNYEDTMKARSREHRTTVNIDLSDRLSDNLGIRAYAVDPDVDINVQSRGRRGRHGDPQRRWGRRLDGSQTAGSDDSHSGDSDQSLHLSDKKSKQINPLNFATLINNPNKKIT